MATYLDYLTGAGETAATLGSGALAGLLGMPYGVYKGATSGKLGTREANRIAEEEAKRIMQEYTYQPRGQVAPQMMQSLGGLLDASKLPPVIPEAAMLASIPRQAVAAQAERTGMAAERAITQMVNRTMAKGGVGAGLLNAMTPQAMNIVPPSVVRQIDMPVNLPKSKEFFNAVTQEPSAAITPEGLLMNVKRQQVPDQSGMESVRTGVFYLPESQSASVYKGKQGYGGSEPIQGSTLYKNPLFVKGATGGKAPESAYDQLLGKGSYQAMRNEALDVASGYRTPDFERVKKARAFLEKYGGDPDLAEYIVENSKYGNQLTYALQENAVANAVRNAGHDAVLGYSKGRGDKGEFFSEVFDVREQNYPTPQGAYQLMPQFEGLLGAMTPQPMNIVPKGKKIMSKAEKNPKVAMTSDGYKFYEQPDGTYTNGDMTFESLDELFSTDPQLTVDGKIYSPKAYFEEEAKGTPINPLYDDLFKESNPLTSPFADLYKKGFK